jgi:(1->4)-alpha-D-glucan 1-alpha-D-glucosylmutase
MDPTLLADTLLAQASEAAAAGVRLPESTYRLQFHAGFTFRDALAIVPYLRDLGITHCYASPYLKARPGSTHGYDIIDHGCLNPEIGTPEDYEAMVAALREHGLGQILDTVPNHMAVGTNDNAWWNDVLEDGPSSRYGAYFDIAWRASPRPELQDKVLLPVLGEPYGDVLEAGQLRLVFADGALSVHYYDRRFPVAPHSYGKALGHRPDELERALGAEGPDFDEYQSILTAVRNLPDRTETDTEKVAERRREKEVVKRRLAELALRSEPVRVFIEQTVALFNGQPGDPRSFDLLDDLLEHQCYRLAYWRVAPDEINYRRFFDVNDLAALSMEREDVFEAAHGLVLRLLAEGKLDGLRIDHPDGLYDPATYFRRLQEHFALACARRVFEADSASLGLDWKDVEGPLRDRIASRGTGPGRGPLGPPLYVVAEKILGADEALVETWPVHGTSGYEFLNQVNGLFVDGRNAATFSRLYRDRVQDGTSFAEMVYRKKLLIMQISLSSELHMLTHQLDRLAQKSRRSRDFTFNTLRQALGQVIACFSVYRTYIADEGPHDADRLSILKAIRRAEALNPLMSRRVFRFIRDVLLLESPESFSEADRAEQRRFAGKFQQVTAPVTAKGVEDTAFYVYNRLVSLNEVGGDPGRFGIHPEAVHAYNQDRQARWPHALSPLSTHDTKRSEDVRARINVLSEMPEEWSACVERWSGLNERLRKTNEDQAIPDANVEYLLYQTLVGAWPLEPYSPEEYAGFVERIQAYMLKALHEAKVHTSWINPNAEYDAAIQEFVGRILDEGGNRPFLDDFRAFQRRIGQYGLWNSLSQTLLKLASPGVPDTYQGTELWDFSLVDPDNRRPVDYPRRRRMLGDLRSAAEAAAGNLRELARELVAVKEDGRIKLFVTSRTMQCRRDHPGLLSAGEYTPMAVDGPKAAHLFAFVRRAGDVRALVGVPRLPAGLSPDPDRPLLGHEVWQDTRLILTGVAPGIRWRNIFTGEALVAEERDGRPSLAAADVFANFPVALLISEGGD